MRVAHQQKGSGTGALARSVHPDYRLNRLFFKQARQSIGANKTSLKDQSHYFDVNFRKKAFCQL
ncbi:hypothetical protein PsyrCH409_24405 [Pseudomonas viridiflava]|nr:hypothetical protein PsyrCH409_24405 [Pseudomonas viridiflava]